MRSTSKELIEHIRYYSTYGETLYDIRYGELRLIKKMLTNIGKKIIIKK